MTTATTGTAPAAPAKKKSGLRIPGFAQMQRLGKSLMLPIALLPAAGILLRLGQPDLLGGIKTPVIGPFFEAMSAAGNAVFANLPAAVRGRRRDRVRQEGGRRHCAVGGGWISGHRRGVRHHVAVRAGRRHQDQLQRVRRHPGRRHHCAAVRPVPHHSVAVLPWLLRRPPVRADRGVGLVPVPRLRDELLLPRSSTPA